MLRFIVTAFLLFVTGYQVEWYVVRLSEVPSLSDFLWAALLIPIIGFALSAVRDWVAGALQDSPSQGDSRRSRSRTLIPFLGAVAVVVYISIAMSPALHLRYEKDERGGMQWPTVWVDEKRQDFFGTLLSPHVSIPIRDQNATRLLVQHVNTPYRLSVALTTDMVKPWRPFLRQERVDLPVVGRIGLIVEVQVGRVVTAPHEYDMTSCPFDTHLKLSTAECHKLIGNIFSETRINLTTGKIIDEPVGYAVLRRCFVYRYSHDVASGKIRLYIDTTSEMSLTDCTRLANARQDTKNGKSSRKGANGASIT